MGVVYRAHDTLLEREVALKIIGASIEGNTELRERFFREARAAGHLSHRNIITIHDLGEHEGQPYLAMEFLTGEDLQHRLTRPEPMSLSRKLEIAAEICEGLAYAHRRGLIHRDIKPANIFITDEGVVKILDFGLARMVTSELTKSNMMLGTLNYMAPEQVRGERIDHRADIFSFGVVLYEILSGRKAFQGDSFATTLYKILQDVPEPLHNIDATLPHEVVRLVERSIAKARDDRYQDLSDLCRDLALQRQHLSLADAATGMTPAGTTHRVPSDPPRSVTRRPDSGRPKSAPAPLDVISPTILSEAPTGATPLPLPRPERSKLRTIAIVAAVAAIAAAFAGIGWLARRERTPPQQATVESTPPAAAPAPAPTPPAPTSATPPAVPPIEAPAAADTQVVEDARARMARAKAAARQAGNRAIRSESFTAALAAEREGLRSYQAKRLAEAATKFYEAIGLFRSAELAGLRPENLPPPPATQTARNEPAPAQPPAGTPAPPTAAPTTTTSVPPATTSVAPPPEKPVQLPPAGVPGPPVPPPARTTTPPAMPPESPKALEDGVRELVKRYEQALEARSVEALKRLWPSLQGAQEEAIRQEFSQTRRIDVDISGVDVNLNGTTAATVTFIRRYQLTTVDGQRPVINSRTTLNARRNGEEWVIERVRFEAVK